LRFSSSLDIDGAGMVQQKDRALGLTSFVGWMPESIHSLLQEVRMPRMLNGSVVLLVALATSPALVLRAEVSAIERARTQVSLADAASFLGDWTLALEGPNGPATMGLAVKAEQEKVSAELVSDAMGTQAITNIAKADKALVLSYSFTYDGNNVDAAIRLTPTSDGKMAAQIDFAGGAYVMTGTATKKEKAK
jgi:hypothetical protein